jgi:hypothetical protein
MSNITAREEKMMRRSAHLLSAAGALLLVFVAVQAYAGPVSSPAPLGNKPVVKSPAIRQLPAGIKPGTVLPGTLVTVALNPNAVYAGQSSNATVTLNGVAPAEGTVVTVTCSSPSLATVPGMVTIPAGQSSASFFIATPAGSAGGSATIGVSYGGRTMTAILQVVPMDTGPALSTVTSPFSLTAGTPAACTVTLTKPAPAGGATISLSSSSPSILTVPQTVLVPAGQQSGTFNVTAASFTASGNASFSSFYKGVTKTNTIAVMPGSTITSISEMPRYVKLNSQVTGTVTIMGKAPAGGWTVPLYVRNGTDAVVPNSVLVPAGQQSGTLTIATRQGIGVILIYGTESDYLAARGPSQYSSLIRSIQTCPPPVVSSLRFKVCDQNSSACYVNTTQVDGGQGISLEIVTSNPYPDDVTVSLSNSNPQVANIQPTIIFKNGQFFGLMPVTTFAVPSPVTFNLSASYGGVTKSASLTVLMGATVSAVSIMPVNIKGGSSATGTVTLTKAAPAGGVTVMLTSNNPSIFSVQQSVTIGAGGTSASFGASSQPVLSNAAVTINASYAGVAKSATVTVSP